jgi:hypothetical protein
MAAYYAGMKKRRAVQYTIRGVSSALDRCLREKASREGRSLNDTALSLLERGLEMSADTVRSADLDDLAGSWIDDPAFDDAVEQLHRIEPELWK